MAGSVGFENVSVVPTQQREENVAKYGEKDFDVVSEAYRLGKHEGDVYCGHNAWKYIKRYMGNNKKARNKGDLIKALDYLQRMLENSIEKEEVIEK